ncbi:P-loop containing nucleoside triphosphate hydrolase protein [Lasiosphaeria hispida]|uniref:P-loop containing nucleoside triphosphate hydrolase protein n=1 Tax=Lasiosphaeria hispida TaxID=260671 RepID=A0AAJ0HNM2_9PEZI|nr:P-loop containing nucleoside triphosphate hydrolase protein [Lasiosphaeria hispida]
MAGSRQTKQKKGGEVMIALLGVTGAGKSTFASIASGTQLEIGHGVDPCTQEPATVRFDLDGRSIIIIDTPGFDDDKRSDVQILEAIYKWMTSRKGFYKHYALDGLIFLHPVTLNRVGGAERKRTRLLEKILGREAYKRVIIATTMWDDLRSDEIATSRLKGRHGEGGVWNEMLSKGAIMRRHSNNQESAHKIIREVIAASDKYGKVKFLVEDELARNQGRVVRTSAGKELKERITEELSLLRVQLDEHWQDRPSRPSKKGNGQYDKKDPKWGPWDEWETERRSLDRKIEAKESDLKQLNSMVFRIIKLFGRIFAG